MNKKILILLAFIFAINATVFTQAKKPVARKKTPKVVNSASVNKRLVAILLNDNSSVSGTFIRASAQGIQVSILQNKLTVKWKDIRQIIFIDRFETATIEQPNPSSEPLPTDEINRKPFEDAADSINSKIEKNEIDLNRNFTIVLESAINADGKLDPRKSKFVKLEGDEQMIETAKLALEAFGASGFLGTLKEKGVNEISITIAQTETGIRAILLSDMKTAEKAGTAASRLNVLIAALKLTDANGVKKLDDMSKALVNNLTVNTESSILRLDFKLSKEEAQDLIQKALNKRTRKAQ